VVVLSIEEYERLVAIEPDETSVSPARVIMK
jgi:hypothetical protein